MLTGSNHDFVMSYRLKKGRHQTLSCGALGRALQEAVAMLVGDPPVHQLIPSNITADYLTISQALEMPKLLTIMTRTEFKRTTQLDILNNLS